MEKEAGNKIEKEMNVLEETISAFHSCISNSKLNSELKKVQEIVETSFASAEHEQLILKKAVKDLLSLEEEELNNLNEASAERLGSGITQEVARLTQANEKKRSIEEEMNGLQSTITQSEEMERQFEERIKSSSHQTLTAVPKIKARCEAYAQISRLKWDYNAPENVVKGFVIHPRKQDVTPFKIEEDGHSQYFITNFLWEQIGADGSF
ncbi:hypothetical protein SK128_024933 [Halocaridina rubra]|uniref:Kinetochore protein Spc24 n=1 Tax=Halocaridina rubra TaxID=373956 RepID=A0AAN9ACJ0_HALRR